MYYKGDWNRLTYKKRNVGCIARNNSGVNITQKKTYVNVCYNKSWNTVTYKKRNVRRIKKKNTKKQK